MKTLSFHQPWAELILQGRKTLDLRTWRTRYRGRIVVHAGQTVNKGACAAHGLDASSLPRGALVGTVEITGIEPLDAQAFEALRGQHLSMKQYAGPVYGWRLANPRRLPAPLPMPGRRQLYDTPDEVLAQPGTLPEPGAQTLLPGLEARTAPPAAKPPQPHDPAKPFQLRVEPRDGQEYGLAVYQWAAGGNGDDDPARLTRLAGLAGDPLRAVTDQVLEALRGAGYRVTELTRERREPFHLPEERGLRLALLFLAAKPLLRLDRVEAISSGVRGMPSEEAYYWFSKCTAGQGARNAQRALRILLAGE